MENSAASHTPLLVIFGYWAGFMLYFCAAGLMHRKIGQLQTGGGPGMGMVVVVPLFPAVAATMLSCWMFSVWGTVGGGIAAAISAMVGLPAMYWARRWNSLD